MLSVPKKTIIEFSSIGVICLSVGFFIGIITPISIDPRSHSSDTIHEIRNPQDYKFINPLLECDSSNISQDRNLDDLKNKLKTVIDNKIKSDKDISFGAVYYRDLNNGPWFGIHENELFSPASLIKVPLMMAYYQAAQDDPTILQKKLLNTQTYDPASQNVQPELTLQPNQEYTVEELIERMIIYSDNLAYDLLLNSIDNKKVINVYNDLAVDISKASEDPNGNILTVRQYASFFRILFNSSYLNKNMSEKALKLLSQIKYKEAIVAGVPSSVTVSHKFGERQYMETGEKQLHDCGIVYLTKKPYLLCIMTRGKNFNKEASLIKQLSAMVYQNVSNR